jgi:hypothetical protein
MKEEFTCCVCHNRTPSSTKCEQCWLPICSELCQKASLQADAAHATCCAIIQEARIKFDRAWRKVLAEVRESQTRETSIGGRDDVVTEPPHRRIRIAADSAEAAERELHAVTTATGGAAAMSSMVVLPTLEGFTEAQLIEILRVAAVNDMWWMFTALLRAIPRTTRHILVRQIPIVLNRLQTMLDDVTEFCEVFDVYGELMHELLPEDLHTLRFAGRISVSPKSLIRTPNVLQTAIGIACLMDLRESTLWIREPKGIGTVTGYKETFKVANHAALAGTRQYDIAIARMLMVDTLKTYAYASRIKGTFGVQCYYIRSMGLILGWFENINTLSLVRPRLHTTISHLPEMIRPSDLESILQTHNVQVLDIEVGTLEQSLSFLEYLATTSHPQIWRRCLRKIVFMQDDEWEVPALQAKGLKTFADITKFLMARTEGRGYPYQVRSLELKRYSFERSDELVQSDYPFARLANQMFSVSK